MIAFLLPFFSVTFRFTPLHEAVSSQSSFFLISRLYQLSRPFFDHRMKFLSMKMQMKMMVFQWPWTYPDGLFIQCRRLILCFMFCFSGELSGCRSSNRACAFAKFSVSKLQVAQVNLHICRSFCLLIFTCPIFAFLFMTRYT